MSFRCLSALHQRFTLVRLSGSTPDSSYAAFSSTLTTTVFSQRSSRWFDASPHRATPEGHNSSISYAAPHHKEVNSYMSTPLGASRRNNAIQLRGCDFDGSGAGVEDFVGARGV